MLHISAGQQDGWKHTWAPSHESFLRRLRPLAELRRLAFTRDMYSYHLDDAFFEYQAYSRLHAEAWDLHSQCMRAEAIKDGKAFPELKFIHDDPV